MSFQPGTSNRTAIRFARETNFNQVPAAPAWRDLRYTGESLVFTKNTTTSEEIRSDRMTSDLVLVGASAAGDTNMELSFASFDELIEAALCGTWGAPEAGIASLKNGTQMRSFVLQKHFQDLAVPVFQNFSGSRVTGMSLDFQTGQILTGAFNWMGCTVVDQTTQIADSVITQPGNGNPPMNAVTNLVDIRKDGDVIPTKIRSMTLDLTNNARGQEAIGFLGYVGIAFGRLEITGNIELYFENRDEYTTFLSHDDFSLAFKLQDALGNSYGFILPRCKYEEAQITSGSLDQDLMVSGSWRALYHPASNCMIQIDRQAAP